MNREIIEQRYLSNSETDNKLNNYIKNYDKRDSRIPKNADPKHIEKYFLDNFDKLELTDTQFLRLIEIIRFYHVKKIIPIMLKNLQKDNYISDEYSKSILTIRFIANYGDNTARQLASHYFIAALDSYSLKNNTALAIDNLIALFDLVEVQVFENKLTLLLKKMTQKSALDSSLEIEILDLKDLQSMELPAIRAAIKYKQNIINSQNTDEKIHTWLQMNFNLIDLHSEYLRQWATRSLMNEHYKMTSSLLNQSNENLIIQGLDELLTNVKNNKIIKQADDEFKKIFSANIYHAIEYFGGKLNSSEQQLKSEVSLNQISDLSISN